MSRYESADVAILIALREEWDVFWPIAGSPKGVKDTDSARYLFRFVVPSAVGRPYQCVALYVGDMGPTQATDATHVLLQAKPRTMVNLGIAGAIHDDLKLCDVVVADQVDDYLATVKAAARGKTGYAFELRGSVYKTSYSLVQDIDNLKYAHPEAFEAWHASCSAAMLERAENITRARKSEQLRERPEIVRVHLASGPVLAAAEAFSKWVRTRDGLLKALEMEAAGMMLAAHQRTDPTATLVLRGISDFGDRRKAEMDRESGGTFRYLAMFNATQLLWSLLHSGILPRHDPTRSELIEGRLVVEPRTETADRLPKYRRRLADANRSIEIFATDGSDGVQAVHIDLLAAFVPQSIAHRRPDTDQPTRPQETGPRATAIVSAQDDRRVEPGLDPTEEPLPSTIDAALVAPRFKWSLLLGPQGAGKTTVTQWLTLKLCIDGQHPASLDPNLVPVHVMLRNFASKHRAAGAQAYDFFDHLAAQSQEFNYGLQREDFERLAKAGHLLWMFDGIDEILDEEEQGAIFEMILGVREFGGRGVLTSRIAGYEGIYARAQRADFHCFTLLPFDDDQVDRFLERWHTLAFPSGGDRPVRRRERLRAAIHSNAQLHDLSRTPFLLSIVVAHIGAPPYGLRDLLERATGQILVQWDKKRQIVGPAQFPHVLMRKYLEALAWHMMDSPHSVSNSIRFDDLHPFTRNFCAQHIADEANVADSIARELLDHIRERTCILGYTGGDAFGFHHRTFLSFLAASAVYHQFVPHDLDTVETLFRDRWRDRDWLQTLVLICGFLRDDSDRVVRLLQVAIGSVEPCFPFTALDSLAELCIVGLAEVGPLRSGPAQDLASAINAWLYYSPEWHGVNDRLAQLFASAAGRWPGLVQTMKLPLANDRHGGFILPFLCGLSDDELFTHTSTMIAERRATPFLVHRLQHVQRWRVSFTQALQAHAAASSHRFTVLVFALVLAHEAYLPWSLELQSAVLQVASPEYLSGLRNLLTAVDKQPEAMADIARHLRLDLTLELGELWPELVFSREFDEDLHRTGGHLTPKGLESVRRAFTAVTKSPRRSAGLFHEIVFSQDVPFFDALLDYCGRHPSLTQGLYNALLYEPWDAGLTRAIAWASKRPILADFARELTALHALLFPPEDSLFDRARRSLDKLAQDDQQIVPTVTWFSSVMSLTHRAGPADIRAMQARLLEFDAERYVGGNLEFRLAVVAFLGLGQDAILRPLIEQASAQRPLIAVHYRQYLSGAERDVPAGDAEALIADVRNAEDEKRLLELARRERWNSFWQRRPSPWKALYRHLVEHGTNVEIRREAAVQLAEREYITELLSEVPDSPELVDMLRFLDARDDLLRIGS